ncbi:hypothetical protein EDC04DRAFT_2891354 [Pisolithus marmoratus]|nr:hypothetical protein EDC04DRAFT_2891354 [Pisolithus marmoratus]
MSISVNDNPVLVAPRPVRVTSVYPHFPRSTHFRLSSAGNDSECLAIPEDNASIEERKLPSRVHSSASADKESCSSRASPLSSLPSEALEEFLSILRPAMFPPTSPTLRPRRNAATSLSIGMQYRSRTKLDLTPSKSEWQCANQTDDNDAEKGTVTCSPEPFGDNFTANWDAHASEVTSRWHAQILASPISRMHTRNPFPRYASQEVVRPSSNIPSTPVSPAAVPLPVPSPDELREAF